MATVLGPGRYVFGEDIPLGKYTIKAVAGTGAVTAKLPDGEELFKSFYAEEGSSYYGLTLLEGEALHINGSLQVEIEKSMPPVIE